MVMTVREYNAMQEAKGTPKVWIVDRGSSGASGMIFTEIFATKEEAKEKYDMIPKSMYKKMYQTWDIWNWTQRNMAASKTRG